MVKWADYLITAVWFAHKNEHRYISHVLFHVDIENDLSTPGNKRDKDYVISLLKKGRIISTARWSYSKGDSWTLGANINYEEREGELFLRTDPNASESDNLENLIDMRFFT